MDKSASRGRRWVGLGRHRPCRECPLLLPPLLLLPYPAVPHLLLPINLPFCVVLKDGIDESLSLGVKGECLCVVLWGGLCGGERL